MADRHNGYGPSLSEAAVRFGAAMHATAEQLARQGHAAAFTAPPATAQWTCPCGGVNPASRTKCRFCGEPHACDDSCPCEGGPR